MSVTIDGVLYCCGSCFYWHPTIGCRMPATPSTVNCGRTDYDNLCEQWTEKTALDRFREKIATPERRAIRVGHYLDNAINGADS
jgi:hypothetical protein